MQPAGPELNQIAIGQLLIYDICLVPSLIQFTLVLSWRLLFLLLYVIVNRAMEGGTLWKNHTGGDENMKVGELRARTVNNNDKWKELC